MSKNQVSEMTAAVKRVEAAQSQLANARRRQAGAEERLRTARNDVGEAEIEVKESTAALEGMIRKALPLAMRKGGSSAALAFGEIIARLTSDGDDGGSASTPPAAQNGSARSDGAGGHGASSPGLPLKDQVQAAAE